MDSRLVLGVLLISLFALWNQGNRLLEAQSAYDQRPAEDAMTQHLRNAKTLAESQPGVREFGFVQTLGTRAEERTALKYSTQYGIVPKRLVDGTDRPFVLGYHPQPPDPAFLEANQLHIKTKMNELYLLEKR